MSATSTLGVDVEPLQRFLDVIRTLEPGEEATRTINQRITTSQGSPALASRYRDGRGEVVQMAFAPATRGAWARHQPDPVTPSSLDDLRGPLTGRVTLPLHLEWSGRRDYDLTDTEDLVWMYSRVIREASNVEDLTTHLDGPTLVRLWPELRLPARHVLAWQHAFPQLQPPTAA